MHFSILNIIITCSLAMASIFSVKILCSLNTCCQSYLSFIFLKIEYIVKKGTNYSIAFLRELQLLYEDFSWKLEMCSQDKPHYLELKYCPKIAIVAISLLYEFQFKRMFLVWDIHIKLWKIHSNTYYGRYRNLTVLKIDHFMNETFFWAQIRVTV